MSSFDSPRLVTGPSSGPLSEGTPNGLSSSPTSTSPIASRWTDNNEGPSSPWNRSNSVISTASVLSTTDSPAFYERAWLTAEPAGGYVSVAALQRVLSASGIKASQQEKVSPRPRLLTSIPLTHTPCRMTQVLSLVGRGRINRDGFFCALALIAFAQLNKELSIEAVSVAKDSLPIPTLPTSFSTPPIPPTSSSRPQALPRSTSELSIDPWNSTPRKNGVSPPVPPPPAYGENSNLGFSIIEDESDVPFGVGLQNGGGGMGYGEEGWKLGRQSKVTIEAKEELAGWILKHNVWFVRCDKTGSNVERRYSDFVWLLDCLIRRYPFRLLPNLPPKRLAVSGRYLAADDLFLERRRTGLERFLTYLINHPILKHDGLVHTFLTEQNELAVWRKDRPISLEEESASRTLTASEEMTIPEDLEDRLAQLRTRIISLCEHWTRLSAAFDRVAHRRQNQGGDLIRLKVSLDAVVETERSGWRVTEVESIEHSTVAFGELLQRQGEVIENSAKRGIETTVEEIKRHRELYLNFRDLFQRQFALSPDAIDKLKRRVDVNLKKLASHRDSPKPTSPIEVDKLTSQIESDQKSIDHLLKRRVYIRYCMWNEMLFLFRSCSLLKPVFEDYGRDEVLFGQRLAGVWQEAEDSL